MLRLLPSPGQPSAAAARVPTTSGPSRQPTVGAASRRRRAKKPGQFEVKVTSPPPRSLGIQNLPPDTHNGDVIEVAGTDYVVDSLVIQFKLVRGRYQRAHHRLDVQSVSRYFTNLTLRRALEAPGPKERQ